LIERSRALAVTLAAKGDPGERISSVQVSRRGEILGAVRLRWEVTAGIKAAPSALLVSSGSSATQKTISLRSQDGKAFEVLDVSSDLPGIRKETSDRGAKVAHVVRIAIEPGRENVRRWGQLTIRTTHPTQPIVKVAVFLAGPSLGAETPREAP
jgi:hypothetical protein